MGKMEATTERKKVFAAAALDAYRLYVREVLHGYVSCRSGRSQLSYQAGYSLRREGEEDSRIGVAERYACERWGYPVRLRPARPVTVFL